MNKKNGEKYINIYSDLKPKELRQIHYKRKYKIDNPNWDESLVYLASKFSELTKDGSTILDAGCGNGNYVIDENRPSIKTAIGVDADKNATERNICLNKIIIGDLEHLPFESETFDACINLWVLEHLQNTRKSLAEIHRTLKPDGLFFFATPNYKFFPLKIIHLLKSDTLNHNLNRFLFDRDKRDVFATYYRLNTIPQIEKQIEGLFEVDQLFYNFDPSYTSFNNPTYKLTKAISKIDIKLKTNYFKAHIVGILRKV